MSIDITTLALAKEYTNRMVGSGGTGGGVNGKDGITPHIGDNGNWFIGTVDTGVSAQGPAGENGVTPHIGTNGNWYIGSVNTGVSAKGVKGDNGLDGNGIKSAILNSDYTLTLTFDDGTTYTTPSIRGATGDAGSAGKNGTDGKDGSDGVGIASIKQTTTSTADGGNNVFTVTLTNGTTATFIVKNGSKGSTGKDGSNGVDGGHYTPVVTQPTTDTMQISFAPSKSDMPAVNPVTVNLPVSENSGQNADLKYYSEVGGGGIIANAQDYKNEIWTNWNGRLGFGMNTANAPVPFWVHGQILADGTIIARNVASGMQDQVNNRWGMHLFEGYSTDDYSRFTILADKFEHDYRKVACVYYYTGASEADSAYGFVKLGSDAEMHSFDFTRDLLQAHGVIDCRMPITLARISLTNDIDTTYETVEEADAAHAAGTEWEANLRCLRYIYLKNAANGSMFYDADIHAPVIKVDGSWCKIPTEKLTDERYTVLGQEFDPVPCTGLTLSASALTFANTSLQTLTAAPTPADTTDRVVWESSDPSIATVKNGIVTPKWNGSCTITAVCGNQRAECAVTISGVEFEPIDTINLEAGYKYDLTTGAKTAAESYFCTNKFRLSDGQWSITNRAHSSAVLVWDAEGNYLGSFSNGWNHPNTDTTTTRTILARADCLYAIQYGLDALEDDLTLMAITKATPSSKIATVKLNLADCAFVDAGSGFAAYSLAGTAGFDTIASHIALTAAVETASIPVFLAGAGGSSWAKGIGYGLASIGWIKDGAGTYKPNLIFAGTAADANAYFAEHRTVLTIN